MVDQRFVSGPPEKIRIHDAERVKHPVEFEACLMGYDPHAARFTPAPARKPQDFVPPSIRPDESWCTGCREYHPVSQFHKDGTRPNGLQHYCKEYRAAYRKVPADAKPQASWRWHRAAK